MGVHLVVGVVHRLPPERLARRASARRGPRGPGGARRNGRRDSGTGAARRPGTPRGSRRACRRRRVDRTGRSPSGAEDSARDVQLLGAETGDADHADVAVAPWLRRDPLDQVVAVACSRTRRPRTCPRRAACRSRARSRARRRTACPPPPGARSTAATRRAGAAARPRAAALGCPCCRSRTRGARAAAPRWAAGIRRRRGARRLASGRRRRARRSSPRASARGGTQTATPHPRARKARSCPLPIGHRADRGDDVLVARAAAEVAADRRADLPPRRVQARAPADPRRRTASPRGRSRTGRRGDPRRPAAAA